MIVALLLSVIVVGVTGALLDTDRFFGDQTLEDIHSFVGHLFVPLVVLHVGGVIFTSFRQKENLVTAMIIGRKAPPDEGG
jgi:cytochrome b